MVCRSHLSRREFVTSGVVGAASLCAALPSAAFAEEAQNLSVPVPACAMTLKTAEGLAIASTDPSVPITLAEDGMQYSLKADNPDLYVTQIGEDLVWCEAAYKAGILRGSEQVVDNWHSYAIAYVEVKCGAYVGNSSINVLFGYAFIQGKENNGFSVINNTGMLLVAQGPPGNGMQKMGSLVSQGHAQYRGRVDVDFPTINYYASDFNGSLVSAECRDTKEQLTMLVDCSVKF